MLGPRWVSPRGGLGWMESGLRQRWVHCLCILTSLTRLGPDLWLSGLTAAQTADSPQTPRRRW